MTSTPSVRPSTPVVRGHRRGLHRRCRPSRASAAAAASLRPPFLPHRRRAQVSSAAALPHRPQLPPWLHLHPRCHHPPSLVAPPSSPPPRAPPLGAAPTRPCLHPPPCSLTGHSFLPDHASILAAAVRGAPSLVVPPSSPLSPRASWEQEDDMWDRSWG